MTKRDLMTVDHPCILCEGTLTISVLRRDDETGEEEWTHEPQEHFCSGMMVVRRERVASNYAKTRRSRGFGD